MISYQQSYTTVERVKNLANVEDEVPGNRWWDIVLFDYSRKCAEETLLIRHQLPYLNYMYTKYTDFKKELEKLFEEVVHYKINIFNRGYIVEYKIQMHKIFRVRAIETNLHTHCYFMVCMKIPPTMEEILYKFLMGRKVILCTFL